jgi:DNA-directed RNA polymerase specialized sigma24 family protein
MGEHDWLAEQFEDNRAHLRAVAYRMLGSQSEADDAVQESWLRLSRSDTSGGRTAPRRLRFQIADGKIVQIDLLADPETLGQLDLALLAD